MQRRLKSIFAVTIAIHCFSLLPHCQAQSINFQEEENVSVIYELSKEKCGTDQLLTNGVFFEDIYRLAIGHPYFLTDTFFKASIIYHHKLYEDVEIKFDIHSQKVLIKLEQKGSPLIIVLTNEFISELEIFGKRFSKKSFYNTEQEFYQMIDGSGAIQCYYSWYKNRRETINKDDKLISNFSKDKRRSYIFLDGVLSRYVSNRSFKKLFPADMKTQIDNYLKANTIKVRKASDQEIRDLISYCENQFNRRKL